MQKSEVSTPFPLGDLENMKSPNEILTWKLPFITNFGVFKI